MLPPPAGFALVHVQRGVEREDELFYVLEGEHLFQIGDEEHRASPAGTASPGSGAPPAQSGGVIITAGSMYSASSAISPSATR